MDILAWQKKVHQVAVEHGWWEEDRNFGEVLSLIHSEVSEALGEWRNGHAISDVYFIDGKPEGVPIELADCVIRIMDVCEAQYIDLEQVIALKTAYNETRPYRHGNKLA